VDDYGHHPVEIRAVLTTARQVTKGAVHAVIQPHRYSRLATLWNDFATCGFDADTVTVLPVYSAGEAPQEGINHQTLAAAMTTHGHKNAMALDKPEDLAKHLAALAHKGDYVVCLGAGNITTMANALPAQMSPLVVQPVKAAGAR
jgi:UDP-N-acetylmuramate--alanine ligase